MSSATGQGRETAFAASLLEASARTFSAFAARDLLDNHPDIGERFAPQAESSWQSHFVQRLLELSVALDLGIPRLFAARMEWSARAFLSRDLASEDLAKAFQCLAGVLRAELPEPARSAVDEYLVAGSEAIAGAPEDEEALDPANASDTLALEYLLTVLEGDPQRAIRSVLTAIDEGLAIRDAYFQVLIPAQREIGRMWHRGELGVAEEHLTTQTTQRLMSILSQRAAPSQSNGKTVMAASVAGNSHDLGIRIVSDFFALDGWRALCLGADLPTADLVDAVRYFNADLVVLSATLSTQLRTLRETVQRLREVEGDAVKIMVGGLALAETPDLWRQLGADGYSTDAAAATGLGRELVGLPS